MTKYESVTLRHLVALLTIHLYIITKLRSRDDAIMLQSRDDAALN